jgi:hypothetical protein
MLTIPLHIAPGLRISGVLPVLPVYALTAETGTALHLPYDKNRAFRDENELEIA